MYMQYSYWHFQHLYMPAYCLGLYLGRFYKEFENKETFVKYVIVFSFISLFVNIGISDYFYKVVAEMLPIMAVYYLPNIPRLNNRRIYKLTFIIYAIHQPVLRYCSVYFKELYLHFLHVSFNNLFIRFLILIYIIFVAMVIYKVSNKISPKFTKILTGGR